MRKIRSFRAPGDPHASVAVASLEGNAWTDEHDKGRTFAEQKLFQRKVEASIENLLHPDEDTDQLQWHGHQKIERMVNAQAQRDRRARRSGLHIGGGSLPSSEELHGETCYVQKSEHWPALQAHGLHMVQVMSPDRANVMVVDDMSKPPTCVKWLAVLGGCMLTTVTELTTSTGRGACLRYHRAVSSSRFIYITDAFKAKHPTIYEFVERRMRFPDSRWVSMDLATFVAKKSGVYKNRTECLGLGCRSDMANEPLCALKHVFDGPAFIKFIAKVDFEKSSSGLLRCRAA